MLDNILRILNGYLSIWCKKNKPINNSKDKKIIKQIEKKNLQINVDYKNLKTTHRVFNKKLYLLLKEKNIKNFLRINFIQKMFFLQNRFFVFSELKLLKKDKNWLFYQKLIKENSIGNPIRFFLYQDSSGNRINHVYHLSVLINELDIDLSKIDNVFEFGAGYGCMANIFSKISKKIKYVCFDTPYVNLLQYYYLKHCDLDVGFTRKNKFYLISSLKKIQKIGKESSKSLFIANWSLSETPYGFRKKFIPLIKSSDVILICFQEKFERMNNLIYFVNLKKKISENFEVKIIKNKFYTGNLINRQKHYFFVARKI